MCTQTLSSAACGACTILHSLYIISLSCGAAPRMTWLQKHAAEMLPLGYTLMFNHVLVVRVKQYCSTRHTI